MLHFLYLHIGAYINFIIFNFILVFLRAEFVYSIFGVYFDRPYYMHVQVKTCTENDCYSVACPTYSRYQHANGKKTSVYTKKLIGEIHLDVQNRRMTMVISTTNLAACVSVQNLTNFCPSALISTPNVPKILFA